MVRAESGSIFGSLGDAYSSECKVCGKQLNYKENKELKNASGVFEANAQIAQAKHCGYIYVIGAPGSTFQVQTIRDPKFVEKENKLNEKVNKANKLRQQGKTDEAIKLENEIQEDAEELQKQEDTEEPKAGSAAREEERRGAGRPRGT